MSEPEGDIVSRRMLMLSAGLAALILVGVVLFVLFGGRAESLLSSSHTFATVTFTIT